MTVTPPAEAQTEDAPAPRGQRRRRVLAGVVFAVLLVAGGFVFGGGWYYAGQVLEVPPPDPGSEAYLFDDPGEAGLPFTEVEVLGPLGTYPAWLVGPDAPNDTWVIGVHGRGATRGEGIRLATLTVPAGYPTLLISIRNDDVAPPSENGHGYFGSREWADLAAAVDHAIAFGAEDVILAGFSQGASLSAFYMRQGDPDVVRGMILDSPLLALHDTLVFAAEDRGIPGPLIPPLLWGTKVVLSIQAGFDSAAPEHLDHVEDWLVEPTLVIHGTGDETVPVTTTDELVQRAPERLVTYLRVDGAGHVRGFNAARAAYEDAVTAFLDRVGAA